MKDQAGDLDKDERVSVLESFIYARNRTAEWYKDQGILATEHSLLDDNGDGRGAREPGYGGSDGVVAGRMYFGRRSIAETTTGFPEERSLRERMEELRLSIDELKGEKPRLDPEAYSKQMEVLLIELAQLNRRLRTLAEDPP